MSLALALAVLAGVLGAAIHTAHAKSLGGVTSKSLYGKKATISAITDKFDETNNLNLERHDGRQRGRLDGRARLHQDLRTRDVTATSCRRSRPLQKRPFPARSTRRSASTCTWRRTSNGCGVVLNAAGTSSYAATFLSYNRSAKLLTLAAALASGAISCR